LGSAKHTFETTGLSYEGGREIILKLILRDLNHYTAQLNCFIMYTYTPLRLHRLWFHPLSQPRHQRRKIPRYS